VSDARSVRAATQERRRDLGMTTIFGNPGSTEFRAGELVDALGGAVAADGPVLVDAVVDAALERLC